MQRLLRVFNEHPQSVDETYWQHLLFAAKFSSRLFLASFAALLHAIFPFLFERTASKIVKELVHKTHNRS